MFITIPVREKLCRKVRLTFIMKREVFIEASVNFIMNTNFAVTVVESMTPVHASICRDHCNSNLLNLCSLENIDFIILPEILLGLSCTIPVIIAV